MGEDAGRVAVVTGGSGGLGGAVAARLRADGFRVASADIDVPDGDASAVPVDVTDPDSAAAMCAWVLDRWGRIDVLVNNAGIAGPTAPVASYPLDAWHRVIAVNLGGVFHCTRACLPPMTAADRQGARGGAAAVPVADPDGPDGPAGRTGGARVLAGVRALLVQHRRCVRPVRRPRGLLTFSAPPAGVQARPSVAARYWELSTRRATTHDRPARPDRRPAGLRKRRGGPAARLPAGYQPFGEAIA